MQEVKASASSSMARKACMRLLEQLERTPCSVLAPPAGVGSSSEGSNRMVYDPAPLRTTGSEGAANHIASDQDCPGAYGDSQQGSGRANGSYFTGCDDPKQAPDSTRQKQSCDIAALAALTVQISTRRLHFKAAADTGYWRSQIPTLPAAAQHLALACLAERPVQKLLRDSFFTAEVRAAADYLANLDATISNQQQAAEHHGQPSRSGEQLQTVLGHAYTLQAMLDGPLDLKVLAKRGALRLCMQSIVRIIADVAREDSPSHAAASEAQQISPPSQSPGALIAQVLLSLITLSSRSLAIQSPLQAWAALLGGRAPCDLPASPGQGIVQVEVQTQLMQAARLRQVISFVGLSAYMDTLHSSLLSAVCGGTSDAGEPAAAQLTQHAIQVCPILLEQNLWRQIPCRAFCLASDGRLAHPAVLPPT